MHTRLEVIAYAQIPNAAMRPHTLNRTHTRRQERARQYSIRRECAGFAPKVPRTHAPVARAAHALPLAPAAGHLVVAERLRERARRAHDAAGAETREGEAGGPHRAGRSTRPSGRRAQRHRQRRRVPPRVDKKVDADLCGGCWMWMMGRCGRRWRRRWRPCRRRRRRCGRRRCRHARAACSRRRRCWRGGVGVNRVRRHGGGRRDGRRGANGLGHDG